MEPFMPSEETDLEQSSITQVIYRFLGGAALGAFVLAIPILYGASINLSFVQVAIASVVILSCGMLSIVWGEKFINTVMRVLDGTGF